jgi:stage IV sporulation protein FB
MKSFKIRLFKFLGTPVNLDISSLLLFVFFDITISTTILASILIHEMAHIWMAHKRGYKIYGINIGLITGSASMENNITTRDSITIVLAGPVSNLILVIISLIIEYTFTGNHFIDSLFSINLFIFIFNILPIIPMDGGYILRDSLISKMDNDRLAIKISIYTSIITSILLIVISFIIGYYLISLFSLYFIYLSYSNLKKYEKILS